MFEKLLPHVIILLRSQGLDLHSEEGRISMSTATFWRLLADDVLTTPNLTAKASTAKASTKASTAKASTAKASAKASTAKASTKASTAKASTTKASTTKASTAKASTAKAKASAASAEVRETLLRELRESGRWMLAMQLATDIEPGVKRTTLRKLIDEGHVEERGDGRNREYRAKS